MEEMENYSEQIHEHANEKAHEALAEGKDKWILFVALTTAVFAVLAAISSLLAGDHADEAMLAQIKSSDQWAFYQAKGIKADVLSSTNTVLQSLGKPTVAENASKIKNEQTEQEQIKKEARQLQAESDGHIARHRVLARAVTLFQIAIAVGAISIITKRKLLWLASIGFALVAIFFLLQGTLF